MKATYVWTPRAHVAIDPEVAGRELKRLAKHGEVTAAVVIDAARPEDAPLHAAFEWDDAVAAEKHRAEQARLILRSIRIIREPEKEPERVYWHVETEDLDAYVTTARVMAEDDLHRALVDQCTKTLIAARRRFAEVQEMAPVWDAIDQLEMAVV